MSKLTNQSTWFSDNEKNWNDRANLHMAGDYCGLRRLLAEPDAISAELALDIGRFGDLAGKQVVPRWDGHDWICPSRRRASCGPRPVPDFSGPRARHCR